MSKKIANLIRLAEIQADLHRRLPPPEYIEKTLKAQTAVLSFLGENTSENNKAKGGLLTNQKEKAKPTQTESSAWGWAQGVPPNPKEGDCLQRDLIKVLIEWHKAGRERPTAALVSEGLRCFGGALDNGGGFNYIDRDNHHTTKPFTYNALNKRIKKLID